jgi:major type 1 subunit fimbrin (pilin)
VNTLIKRAMLTAGIATAMSLPLASQASDGTIKFTGAVTANTCAVSVNSGINGATGGAADATVVLPIVSTAALTNAAASGATAAKTTAAGTFFSMTLGTCTASHADIGGVVPGFVNIYFEAGPNVDVLTGGLINGGTSNVEVNLYNASSAAVVGTQIFPGTNTGQNPTGSGLSPSAGGTNYYYAGYSTAANGGALATAGTVTTSVTYSLVYQ